MTTASTPPTGKEIEAQATDFLQRRRFWNWGDEDQHDLEAWIDQSTAHRIAFLRCEAGLERLEGLSALRGIKADYPDRGERRRFGKFAMLIAASAVLVAALGYACVSYLFAEPPDRKFATEVGGRALLSFADGTRMELNTDTSVRYRMTNEERTVWLNKGEVWFHVAHDPEHPFRVFFGDHSVTDLGTEFFIRSDSGHAEVALLKGRAQLNTAGGQSQSTLLTPGDDAVATGASIVMTKKTSEELANELGWQRGIIVFRNTRLSDAVREFNRYNRTKLVIADPAVARMTLGGEFKTDNLGEFLDLLQVALRLHVDRQGNDILLSRDAGETRKAAHERRGQ